jgi:ribonuclease/clavin/mitogillin
MCFYLEEERSIFAGDNVLGHGTTVFEDLGQYMKSLDTMHNLVKGGPQKILYPGHGEYVKDAARKITEYITHRKRREKQILQSLKEAKDLGTKHPGSSHPGTLTSLDIVKKIYMDADESLYRAAEGGTVQVLEKLERDGVVGWEEAPAGGDGRKLWYMI